MSIGLIGEVWKLLRSSIEAGDVKNTFRGDKDIKDALDFYLETPEDGLIHEYEDDLDEEDYYDYYDDEEDDQY